MEQADSIALDPHKWLYLPVDVGCVIFRDPETARSAFAQEAEYTRMFGEEADEAFVCWDYGPELSRRFRALKVWMLLKGVGLDRLSDVIEGNLACARYLESMVQASDDFEMVAPVGFRFFVFDMCQHNLGTNRRSKSMPSTNDCWSHCSKTAARISPIRCSAAGSPCADAS
jgi:glutamate/tyrosine decarboxylase-like PLP-dependent enzyme